MAHLYRDLSVKSLYTDRKFDGGQRQWQQALEKFEKAAGIFDEPVEVPALRTGMCRAQLRMRFAADAVKWCQRAHEGAADDLEVLFLFADARVLNGEDHAALQLLRTAQRRFPRAAQLHQRIQNLERAIKNKGKVNHYKERHGPPPARPASRLTPRRRARCWASSAPRQPRSSNAPTTSWR